MGDTVAPDGTCTLIVLVLCLFLVVFGGTNLMYDADYGKKSLSGSLSMSSIEHVEGIFCLERRGEEMGDGVSDFVFFLYV